MNDKPIVSREWQVKGETVTLRVHPGEGRRKPLLTLTRWFPEGGGASMCVATFGSRLLAEQFADALRKLP